MYLTVPYNIDYPRTAWLVCGLYKSGTSLAAEWGTYLGFKNPAKVNNPLERGYGSLGNRYLTNECIVLRQINEHILTTRELPSSELDDTTIELIQEYIKVFPPPISLKDPSFVYSLDWWIRILLKIEIVPIVIFTNRPLDELHKAWETAPYTKNLLSRGHLPKMHQWLLYQQEYTSKNNISSLFVTLDQLKEWRLHLHTYQNIAI